MKRQIRRGVFETNSSSVHALAMCTESEFDRWKNGELLFWEYKNKFGTKEELIEELKKYTGWNGKLWYRDTDWDDEDQVAEIFNNENITTCDQFFDNEWYETYSERYTTPGGETIVAFGYYGHD
nr:hypothetical protein [Clostridium sp. Marseille-P7770]